MLGLLGVEQRVDQRRSGRASARDARLGRPERLRRRARADQPDERRREDDRGNGTCRKKIARNAAAAIATCAGWRSARLPMRSSASSTSASTAGFTPKKSACDERDVPKARVERARARGSSTKPGRTKSSAGDEPAARAVHQPADVGGELLRLGPGQQHAVVERMEEALFADPALLLDQDAVHDRDLSGGAAEALAATRSQVRKASAWEMPWPAPAPGAVLISAAARVVPRDWEQHVALHLRDGLGVCVVRELHGQLALVDQREGGHVLAEQDERVVAAEQQALRFRAIDERIDDAVDGGERDAAVRVGVEEQARLQAELDQARAGHAGDEAPGLAQRRHRGRDGVEGAGEHDAGGDGGRDVGARRVEPREALQREAAEHAEREQHAAEAERGRVAVQREKSSTRSKPRALSAISTAPPANAATKTSAPHAASVRRARRSSSRPRLPARATTSAAPGKAGAM